jgi:hypothetical protein
VAPLTWGATATVAQVATELGPKDGAGLPPTNLGRVAVGPQCVDDQEKKETGVLAVAIDSNADLQKMADKIAKDGKTPNVVSDPGHWMIDRYEIWNPCVGGGI